MNSKHGYRHSDCQVGQAALEYMMTYGWVLIAIIVVIGSILVLTAQSSSPHTCQATPSSGGLTYLDHYVSQAGEISIFLQNDTGKTISDVNLTYSGDFSTASPSLSNGPFTSTQQFKITKTGATINKGSYSGAINIVYKRNGVSHASTVSCTGNA